MRDDMHDWVVANEHMAKVLAAKGYHYQFVFARNAGHMRPRGQAPDPARGAGMAVAGLPAEGPMSVEERRVSEPDWLTWTRELQAMAQTGLAFSRDPYDRDRYEALRALASRMMAAHTGAPAERIEDLFRAEQGYTTPKVDVRGAVFDAEGRILMVREVAGRRPLDPARRLGRREPDGGRERGQRGPRGERLRGPRGQARRRLGPCAPGPHGERLLLDEAVLRLRAAGRRAATSLETSEVAWFAEDALPLDDLSMGRVLPGQLGRMFEHYREPELPADFD